MNATKAKLIVDQVLTFSPKSPMEVRRLADDQFQLRIDCGPQLESYTLMRLQETAFCEAVDSYTIEAVDSRLFVVMN